MQVGEQIIDLFVIEHVAEAFHFVASHADDILDPVVVGRHPAGRQVVSVEYPPQTWSPALPRRIRRVAAIAILVVDMPACGLARGQAEFSITSAPLDLASNTECNQKNGSASLGHDIRAAEIKKLPFRKKHLSHQNDWRINSFIPHRKLSSRTWQYQQGLCAIFTN